MEEDINTMDSQQNTQTLEISPGTSLRLAREAIGLTPKDVANALYLTSEHISKIEADDYSGTLGLTFERGYLRSYARLVGLPEDDVIAAFNVLEVNEPQTVMPAGMYMKPITTKPKHLRWITSGVGLLLLLSLVVWWQNQSSIAPIQPQAFAEQSVPTTVNLSEADSNKQVTDTAQAEDAATDASA